MALPIPSSSLPGGNNISRSAERQADAAHGRSPAAGVRTDDTVELSVVGRRMGDSRSGALKGADAATALLTDLRERMQAQPGAALAAQAGQAEPRLARLLTVSTVAVA